MRYSLPLFVLTLSSAAWAGLTIAPTGYELYLKMGTGATADLVSNGGRFDGQLSNTAAKSQTPFVNLWCVDAQLSFAYGASHGTKSLGFGEINGESTSRPTTTAPQAGPSNTPWASGQRDIRYEDVNPYNSNPDPLDNFRFGLQDTTGDAVSTNDGALFRYRMGAFLLDQYQAKGAALDLGGRVLLTGGDIGQGKYDPRNNTRNHAIIEAVWVAMDTDFDTDYRSLPAANSDTEFWFRSAVTYVKDNWSSTSLWSKWAVVSAWVSTCDPSGNSPCYVVNNGDKVQTFLTETPEPGFYGLLCTGLSALVWVATRRRKNDSAAT